MKRTNSGFTLIELMITLVLFAILAGLAAPAFNNVIASNKLISARDSLINGLQLAKTEAISKNKPVAICPSANGTSCSGSEDWSDGWLIYEDSGAGTNSTIDTIIRYQQGTERIDVVHSGHRTTLSPKLFVRFNAQGYATDSSPIPAQTIGFCDPDKKVDAKTIVLSQTTGQARAGNAADVVCP